MQNLPTGQWMRRLAGPCGGSLVHWVPCKLKCQGLRDATEMRGKLERVSGKKRKIKERACFGYVSGCPQAGGGGFTEKMITLSNGVDVLLLHTRTSSNLELHA